MNKLSKEEFILTAAKLYGLGKFEIEALKKHLNGAMPNEYIQRRNEALFRLYEIYKSTEYNEKFNMDENGIINLNDYCFEISKRRLADSKIGKFWIVSSNLETFLSVTTPEDYQSNVNPKFVDISNKNNFILPQIAKQMGLDAAVYYKGEYTDETGTFSTHHLTKNFLYDDETLIQGNSIIKDNPKKKRINFETLLDATDKYVKRYYKKNKLPQEDSEKSREEIRRGLIKQTFFNKFVFNNNESNSKWGLIVGNDKKLRLAPLYSFDYCAGVKNDGKTTHRAVHGRKEDIESFMLQYGKEPWFREWINQKVLTIDLDKAEAEMSRITKITLTPEEKSYYEFVIEKMREKVLSVQNLNYNKELVEKSKKVMLGKKIKKAISGNYSSFEDKLPKGVNLDDNSDAR